MAEELSLGGRISRLHEVAQGWVFESLKEDDIAGRLVRATTPEGIVNRGQMSAESHNRSMSGLLARAGIELEPTDPVVVQAFPWGIGTVPEEIEALCANEGIITQHYVSMHVPIRRDTNSSEPS